MPMPRAALTIASARLCRAGGPHMPLWWAIRIILRMHLPIAAMIATIAVNITKNIISLKSTVSPPSLT